MTEHIKTTLMIVLFCFMLGGTNWATEWEKGEGSHVITDLPDNVKEKMQLKYETIEPTFMKKTVRLTGKVVEQKNDSYESVFTIYKKDKMFIEEGQVFQAETPLFKGKVLKGKVTGIQRLTVENKKRNYEAFVILDNVGIDLQPGTLLNGKSDFQTQEKVIAVPNGAVHVIMHRRCVFVFTGKDGQYELREIQTGFEAGGLTQVTKGLRAEEQIVTDGSFHLRAELLKPETDFGGHGHAH